MNKRAGRRARSRAKKRAAVEARFDAAPDSVGATPETMAKLEEDPLQRMAAAGMIDSAGERAAEEIKYVFLAVCRDVIARTMRPTIAYARGRFEIPDDLATAHAERYLPWCRAQRPRVVEATIDLVVERRLPRSGLLLDLVADALADYARRMEGKGGAGGGLGPPRRPYPPAD